MILELVITGSTSVLCWMWMRVRVVIYYHACQYTFLMRCSRQIEDLFYKLVTFHEQTQYITVNDDNILRLSSIYGNSFPVTIKLYSRNKS